MSANLLTLRAGALEAVLQPGIGGSIVRFDRVVGPHRQPLLRGADGAISDVLDAGSFPMVPYVNRIRGGTFACDGQTITLPRNKSDDASPMHGQGWRAAWEVLSEGPQHASLTYHHAADAWPWEYLAAQHFTLDEQGLSLELTCCNLSPLRMPCGLGFHPYYPCNGETVLDTAVASAWTIDADVLPVGNVPATGRYDLKARRICGQSLDNGFDGWSGTAAITWPGEAASLRMSSPDAGRFQVYSPAQGGLFVAEPVQNANAALNAPQHEWPALGITLLEQGEIAKVSARFEVIIA